MSKNIKILLVGHVPFQLISGEVWLPIHAGRSIAENLHKDGYTDTKSIEWLRKYTIGDDTGDNISDRNRFYSECSALYWAWKNYDQINSPDYIGLMHYRRHFIFNSEYFDKHRESTSKITLSCVNEDIINDEYINRIGLSDKNIQDVCGKYDLIITKDANLKIHHNVTVREDHAKIISGMNVKDFDLMVAKIDELYPEYSDITHKFIHGYKKSLFQMFIMKKELFFEYCQFLFDILFAVENETDFTNYSVNGKRTLGYLAEDLLSIFVVKKIEEGVSTLKLGVTKVNCPYSVEKQAEILKMGCPQYSEYLKYKILAMVMQKDKKELYKKQYKALRDSRKIYKIIEKYGVSYRE